MAVLVAPLVTVVHTQNPVNVRCIAESGTHIQYTYHSCMYITYSAVCVCECVCCSRAFVGKHFVYLDAGAILLLSLCVWICKCGSHNFLTQAI